MAWQPDLGSGSGARAGRSVTPRRQPVEAVRRILRGEPLVNPQDTFTVVARSLPHGHVAAVTGTLKQLGLHSYITRQPSRMRDLTVALMATCVIDPQAKTTQRRSVRSAVHTLRLPVSREVPANHLVRLGTEI